jgi:hypothetical protein
LAALIVQAFSAEIKPEVSSMISEEASTEDLLFPKFEYHLDESDPDIVLLRRQDDAFVAAFSARGALHTREGIASKWLRRISGSSRAGSHRAQSKRRAPSST